MSAYGMAEAALDSMVSLRAAISWHLTVNLFPSPPAEFVDVAGEAIYHVVTGNSEELVELPEGCSWRGRDAAPALVIVDNHRLGAFVDAIVDAMDREGGHVLQALLGGG